MIKHCNHELINVVIKVTNGMESPGESSTASKLQDVLTFTNNYLLQKSLRNMALSSHGVAR